MFFKLMLDTLKIWAKEYRVDGFRFDLMGFSFKNNLLEIKQALHEIDPTIYLYGEGWDFGEVASNALGENATQANMAGTGIGTFSDRGRDAIRGGGSFDRGHGLVSQARVHQRPLVRQKRFRKRNPPTAPGCRRSGQASSGGNR